MSARHGSWGRVLRVDLTTRTTSVEEMDEATFRRNPGGRAMIARSDSGSTMRFPMRALTNARNSFGHVSLRASMREAPVTGACAA